MTRHQNTLIPRNDTARMYYCLRCHSQVVICRRCDHGNVYCVKCAPRAGKEAKNSAAVRYQTTYQGKVKHAARQSRYRERLKEKVTHKGSKDCPVSDLLVDKQKKVPPVTVQPGSAVTTSILCHTCRNLCSTLIRSNFLLSKA